MKTILITAGPVSEEIDPVRIITNRATGNLGALTADAIRALSVTEDIRLLYVCELGSAIPHWHGTETYNFRGTEELALLMKDLLLREKPDAVIHSMAVSDYKVDSAFGETEGERVAIPRRLKIPSGFGRVSRGAPDHRVRD